MMILSLEDYPLTCTFLQEIIPCFSDFMLDSEILLSHLDMISLCFLCMLFPSPLLFTPCCIPQFFHLDSSGLCLTLTDSTLHFLFTFFVFALNYCSLCTGLHSISIILLYCKTLD